MGLELFAAAVCVNVALLVAYHILIARPPLHDSSAGRAHAPPLDPSEVVRLKAEVSDLMTELARVAGTHAAAVEERKESLLQAMEAANERIRRLNALIADAEVITRRAAPAGRPADAPPPADADPRREALRRLRPRGVE